MQGSIDFYFDFSSPYGYFAAMRIEELAARHGRRVDWHPLLLGLVFKHTGGRPMTEIPIRGEYSWRDFERTARFNGIPYNRPPLFPLPTQAAARAMLWLRDEAGEQRAVAFAKAVYSAFFVDGVDISSPDSVARIAAGLGAEEAAARAATSDPVYKARSLELAEQAMARGVFGTPFMIADGEPFWGFDRFPQLDAFLARGSI